VDPTVLLPHSNQHAQPFSAWHQPVHAHLGEGTSIACPGTLLLRCVSRSRFSYFAKVAACIMPCSVYWSYDAQPND
jgi:hypothetical protein